MYCRKCGKENRDSAKFCTICGTELAVPLPLPPRPPQLMQEKPNRKVLRPPKRVAPARDLYCEGIKQKIKELKYQKKMLMLDKKKINNEQKAIRSAYTNSVRHHGPRMIGGGGLGRFVRGIQALSSSAARSALATQLEPLERQKQAIERDIAAIEQMIIQWEGKLLQG